MKDKGFQCHSDRDAKVYNTITYRQGLHHRECAKDILDIDNYKRNMKIINKRSGTNKAQS